jgi:hypothetical protein
MKKVIALEEIAMFVLAVYAFAQLNYVWWLFLALLLLPDCSMVGYLINNKAGAVLYNIFHHKAIAIIIFLVGIFYSLEWLQLAGIILFAHSSMDRVFGYGLKYYKAFSDTHLGVIGKSKIK